MGSEDLDSWRRPNFALSMTDQHPNHSGVSAAENHHYFDPFIWAVGGNPLTVAPDSLPINHYHAASPSLFQNININPRNPSYLLDNPLESEFSRLSLTPATPPPAYIGRGSSSRRYDHFNSGSGVDSNRNAHHQLSPSEIHQMRIESAARAVSFQDYTDPYDAYEVNNYYGPLSLNGDAFMNWNLPNGVVIHYRQQEWETAELEQLRGRILLAAKHKDGCRFLKDKLEEGNREDIHMIFVEIKNHVPELMIHEHGNHLMFRFIDVCSQDEMNQLVFQLTNDQHRFIATCTDTNGTRLVQKLLSRLTTTEQRHCMISALRRTIVALTRSSNAHHVILYCLKGFSSEEIKRILNVIADNSLEIATDQHGCCILQQCLPLARGEAHQRLIAQITFNALMLSEHPYGNYVMQYVLAVRNQEDNSSIIAQLAGKHVSLSFNKYGSNVVEKCLAYGEEHETASIIEELINSPHFVRILQDPFGNYVAQCAIDNSKGAIREELINRIYENHANLHSHPHGKRVLNCIKIVKRMT